MGIPARKLTRLLIDHDPASPEFRDGVRDSLRPQIASKRPADDDLGLWHDVFVEQPLPWGRFFQSAILHAAAFALIWALSLAWLRQQKLLAPTPFDRSSVLTYSPEEYLPPLDTGTTDAPEASSGDPAFAKQPIISVPREADNRSQTIVAPPDLKLNHDVPLPNIIATGAIAPSVPLDATQSQSHRLAAPLTQAIEPAPEVDFARDRIKSAALRSDVVPPPPDVQSDRRRGMAGPESAVIEPPPDLAAPSRGRASNINIGPSEVVAPAPQLTMAEQHVLSSRTRGTGKDPLPGSVQPVAPPPSIGGSGAGGSSQGRLIALGINPVMPTGPVAVPAGNRRGTFGAGPNGKPGASGKPDFGGTNSAANGTGGTTKEGNGLKGHKNGALPEGLHVGAVPGATASIQRNGSPGGDGNGDGTADPREIASAKVPNAATSAPSDRRVVAPVSSDKVTDVDRQVFGDRRFYAMTLNMPNLNSVTGSWVIRFAELKAADKQGELLAPVPTEKSDPGYPLELIRANVHGSVTLRAVIHSDGRVGDVTVLNSADDRLDSYAASALSRWKFLPALKEGKPVALEAVVVIPFRVRKAF
jgi:protein TonB